MSRTTSRIPPARRFAAAGAVAATVVSGLLFSVAPAQAATDRNGVCETGEFCYYYNSGQAGSLSDFTSSVSDLGATQPSCYDFKSAGNGKGVCVKNNAASVWNRTGKSVSVFFNSGHVGAEQKVADGGKVNLNATLKNQNASHRIGGSATPSGDLSDALYTGGGGQITCLFDAYVNTPGRHEGIDIAKNVSSPVRALVGGTVTYVAQGSTGSGGLSTIAIYNAASNKTVIYLHSDPSDSLRAGQTISKGQQIAVESWRGISSSSGHHTHVEMRLGRQTHAAKSVDDKTLDNPNPYSFWQAQGYTIA